MKSNILLVCVIFLVALVEVERQHNHAVSIAFPALGSSAQKPAPIGAVSFRKTLFQCIISSHCSFLKKIQVYWHNV